MDSIPTIAANELRWLAEHADGVRDKPLVLVDDHGEVKVIAKGEADRRQKDPSEGFRVLINLETRSEGPGLEKKVQVVLKYHDEVSGRMKNLELDNKVDAVFLSQSAIDKFVLPYYARFKSLEEIEKLRDSLFQSGAIIAAPHVPPSVTTGVSTVLKDRERPIPHIEPIGLDDPRWVDMEHPAAAAAGS